MNFGEALDELKAGGKCVRTGWNGASMYLKAQFPDEGSKMTHPYLYITIPDCEVGLRLSPWQPAQVDVFAEDWVAIDCVSTSVI